jgi:hypothetical protein
MPNSEPEKTSLPLPRQLLNAQVELAQLQERLSTEFPKYMQLQDKVEDISNQIREKQEEFEDIKRKHRNDLAEVESEALLERIGIDFKEDSERCKKELRELSHQEREVENKINKLVLEDNVLSKLLKEISAKQNTIREIEHAMDSKKSLENTIFIVDTKFDLQKRFLAIMRDVGNLVKTLGGGVLEIAKAIPPIRAVIVGLATIWDTLKTYYSNTETRLSRGTKILAGAGILGLTIAACFVAPALAVILGAVAVFVGAARDQINPWRESRNKLSAKIHELDEINNRVAHVELGVHRISDPNYIRLIEQRDHLQQEVNQLRIDEWDKRKKAINGTLAIAGAILCAIPFPPLQLLGVALLVVTGVVGLVQRYNLLTKTKDFFGWLGNKIFGTKKRIVQGDKKSPAPVPQEKLSVQNPDLTTSVAAKKSSQISSEHFVAEALHGIQHNVPHTAAEIQKERRGLEAQIKSAQDMAEVKKSGPKKESDVAKNSLSAKQPRAGKKEDDTDTDTDTDTGPHPHQHL